ncbi:MAG: hypothetical protein M1832_000785 [Thelocarpon impressellum]|nr:MAG: hypothetical protein M1832_000785 [Thelocarpon impressellum]
MGKAGRFACIFVPFALTLASLICIILVGLGGTNKSDRNLSNLYFFRADTSGFQADAKLDVIPGTDLDNKLIGQGLADAKKNLDLKDFYTVSLWGYCAGSGTTNTTRKVEECSKPRARYWFNFVEVWKINDTAIVNQFPKQLQTGLNTYKTVAGWMYVAYVIAFVSTLVELVFGLAAIFSRWGSLATTIASTVSSIFTLAASATATGLYLSLMGSFNSALKDYGVKSNLGHNMFVATWLAVAFSWGAGLFWMFSTCCCSGRSSDGKAKRGTRFEKTPYTYERVGSPYLGPHGGAKPTSSGAGSSVPLHDMQAKNQAYEPYRHGV